MVAITARFEKRPLFFALAFAAIPYGGLRFYLSGVMHAETALAAAPGSTVLQLFSWSGLWFQRCFSWSC